MNDNSIHVDVVLLAAGRSSRMGQPKALLPWRGTTLLEQACRPFSFLTGRKIAVLNETIEEAGAVVQKYGFKTIVNAHPERGQSESLRVALRAFEKDSTVPLFCAVVDQPLLSEAIVKRIGHTYMQLARAGADEQRLILCPRYGESKNRGNPVLFGSYWRSYLSAIEGDQGGRAILQGAGAPYVKYIDFEIPAGEDVDTLADYTLLYNMWGSK